MSNSSDAAATTTPAANAPVKRPHRWAMWLFFGWLAFVAIGQFAVWNDKIIPDTHGQSIPTMVTVSMGIVTVLLLMSWLLFFPPFPRRIPVAVGILLYLLVVGAFVGSIREVGYSGDMRPFVHFRWEPTVQERLQAYNAENSSAQGTAAVEIDWTPSIEDSPDFRGPHRDGVVASPVFSDDWSSTPPQELWRRPCGEGYAPFAVVGPAAITIEQRGPSEAIVSYDVDTGRENWVHEYPARFSETMGGVGPRAAPVIAGSDVYTIGGMGDMHCVDLSTGKPRWNVNILTANGLEKDGQPLNIVWAMSSAPLVLGDMVVVNAGGPVGNGLVAYSRADGAVLWKGEGLRDVQIGPGDINRAGYSSPELVTLGGEDQILIFDGVGLRSCSPATGDQLWFHAFEHGDSPGRVNVAQPLVVDWDRVFISASYTRGCDMLRVGKGEDGKWSVESVWTDKVKRNMRCKFSSPVLHEGYIYGLDEGFLTCLDVETGERKWKRDRATQYGHGQMLLTNGRIVLLSEFGDLVLIEPSSEGLKELARITALPGERTWNPLALARGRAYLRNHQEAVCLQLPLLPDATETALAPAEAPAQP
ncbi:MAG: PQQ-like beta-propeller repeat protein [Planctomycetaceae bacterium]|nr:PQQ-like beta-propeller repeat protein [Planctomycetaceae bacterium]